MASPLKRKAECLDENSEGKLRVKRPRGNLQGVSVRLMQASEIERAIQLQLDCLLEFCETDALKKDTNDYHTGHVRKTTNQMQRDCDAGYEQYNRRVWVAVNDTGVIGVAAIKPRPRKKLTDRSGVELYFFSVTPGYRGLGVAQFLLKKVEGHCRKERIGAIFLTTQDNLTRAIRFYEKEGFDRLREKRWGSYRLFSYRKSV